MNVADVVADVSGVGGYFEVGTGPGPGWPSFARYLDDGAGFAARVTAAAESLGTGERRVAASILHLGLAARLWSPPLGAAVLHGTLLDWDADTIHWGPAPGGLIPLSLPAPSGHARDGAAALFAVMEPLLTALGDLVLSTVRLAPGLLWGNAASALGGAVRELALRRPPYAAQAVALGAALLDLGPLRGTGRLAEPVPGRPYFTRTSCCLYYRVPGGGLCGDCALRPARAR